MANLDATIGFRIDTTRRKLLEEKAAASDMKLSEYIKTIVISYTDEQSLLDTQKRLREIILESIKDSNDEAYTRILKVLNKLNIAVETIILQLDMVYKYFDIPQRRNELNTHIVEHPITTVARELVIKNIRDMRKNKENN